MAASGPFCTPYVLLCSEFCSPTSGSPVRLVFCLTTPRLALPHRTRSGSTPRHTPNCPTYHVPCPPSTVPWPPARLSNQRTIGDQQPAASTSGRDHPARHLLLHLGHRPLPSPAMFSSPLLSPTQYRPLLRNHCAPMALRSLAALLGLRLTRITKSWHSLALLLPLAPLHFLLTWPACPLCSVHFLNCCRLSAICMLGRKLALCAAYSVKSLLGGFGSELPLVYLDKRTHSRSTSRQRKPNYSHKEGRR